MLSKESADIEQVKHFIMVKLKPHYTPSLSSPVIAIATAYTSIKMRRVLNEDQVNITWPRNINVILLMLNGSRTVI